ncbi:ABC transporter permease [Streptomyces sp. NPDC088910]|uniref:ABC transporter permease n=1 Tax=Streptomyces sp. NPDC088910 TaxID=3365911 RepID=UPI00383009C9
MVRTQAPPPPGAVGAPGSGQNGHNGQTGKADPAAVGRILAAQPGTRSYLGTGSVAANFTGVAGATTVVAYQGDSSWGACQMVSGRWFTAPGEAVVADRFLKAAGVRVDDTVTLEHDGRGTPVRIVGEALSTGDSGTRVLMDEPTLTRVGLAFRPDTFSVRLTAGTDRDRYLAALDTALGPLGLGVFKALGMAPRQTVAMVLTSAGSVGAVAGLAGVPLGIALHGHVLPIMGEAAGTGIPHADLAVYHAPQIALLAVAGLAIAAGGALLPASWAARTRTAVALRTE